VKPDSDIQIRHERDEAARLTSVVSSVSNNGPGSSVQWRD
jgi:hypothetical protein